MSHNRGHPPDLTIEYDGHITMPSGVVAVLQRHPLSVSRVWVALRRRGAHRQYVPIILTQLAEETNLHRSTVRRALARLADAGLARQRTDYGQERWKLLPPKAPQTKEV